MSWSITIPSTLVSDVRDVDWPISTFEAAMASLESQNPQCLIPDPDGRTRPEKALESFATLAQNLDAGDYYVRGSVGGHSAYDGQDVMFDAINVSVSRAPAP